MRRNEIFAGILLTLSIIDFALAAPVLVQEKRQAYAGVVHIPRDAITVLGKRVDDELPEMGRLLKEYFKTWQIPVESSDAHALSSSAPPGPDHGSANVALPPAPNPASSGAHALSSSAPLGPDPELMNVVQAPPPNPASSTANPNPLMEPSSPSPINSESPALSDSEDYEWLFGPEGDDEIHGPSYTPTSSGHGLDHELSSAPPGPGSESTNVVQAPPPVPASSTVNPNPLTEWWSSKPEPVSSSEPEPVSPSGSEHQWLFGPDDFTLGGPHAPQPNPNKRPWTDMEPEPDFDWDYWMAYVNRPGQSPKGFGQASGSQAKHVQQPDPVPLTASDSDRVYSPAPVSVVPPTSTSAELPTEPEDGSKTEPEYDDVQAALYAAKGKAKESRRISGTTRDVGNAAQRELRPDERSLDPGE